MSPIGAAIVVSVMPLFALAGRRIGASVPSTRTRAAAGAILVAGGLGGLALLPKATIVLTIPPQILVGVGLSLVLSALTETALAGRAPQALHGGWTISARHAGRRDRPAGADPDLHPRHRPAARRRDRRRHRRRPRLQGQPAAQDPARAADRRAARRKRRTKCRPSGPVFEPLPEDPADREAVVDLREELQDQLDRGATHAFSPSFGLGALMALLALIPIGLARRVDL